MVKTVGPEMLLDRVDEFDRPRGEKVPRKEVFARRVNFRVAHVLLWNPNGELLIQQLAATRARHPGQWGSSVAAYLFAGEDYEPAARRRLREELAIQVVELKWFAKLEMNDEGCTKFIGCFSGHSDDAPSISDPGHISAIRFVGLAALEDEQASGEIRLTPTFDLVLRAYLNRGAI